MALKWAFGKLTAPDADLWYFPKSPFCSRYRTSFFSRLLAVVRSAFNELLGQTNPVESAGSIPRPRARLSCGLRPH